MTFTDVLQFLWYGYWLIFVSMVVGLIRGRALWSKLLEVPMTAATFLVFSGICLGIFGALLEWLGLGYHRIPALIVNGAVLIVFGYNGGLVVAATDGTRPLHRRGAVVSVVNRLRDRQRPGGCAGGDHTRRHAGCDRR